MTNPTQTKDKPTNGQTKRPTKKPGITDEAKSLSKQEAMQKELTIAEIGDKINEINTLLDQRKALSDNRSIVRQFKNTKQDGSAILSLIDQTGREFRTSNATLVGMVIDFLDEKLTGKITEFSDTIIAYEF